VRCGVERTGCDAAEEAAEVLDQVAPRVAVDVQAVEDWDAICAGILGPSTRVALDCPRIFKWLPTSHEHHGS